MKKIKTIKINKLFIFCIVFIFLHLIIKLVYIGTGNITADGEELSLFASSRDTVKKTVAAPRGTIFSRSNEILAKDVNSYTVIAYLDESRTKNEDRPQHVVDKQMTAEKLSPIINMSVDEIMSLLNMKIDSCDSNGINCTEVSPYQVELGPGGRNISELIKDQIDSLDLPGIDFISSTKRYYPNGDFLSYTLGYVRKNEQTGSTYGEMGLELYYNDELTGEDGYIEYQSDIQGYQITSVPNVEKKAVAGNDIYLTIDNNVQMFTEQAITTLEEGKPEWATAAVMNAKTGEILSIASSPSFNNNTLNITSYYDPFVSNTYEPGSTMKIFSWLAAMENGSYDGQSKFKSGALQVDDTKITDWNNYGWGSITYDDGFMGSSNVAASKLGLAIGRAKLKDFYLNAGYGKKVGIGLPGESDGIINFRYNSEIASASYGQGITVTAIQMLQSLSSIANEGIMLKPYLISKIVDENGNIVEENKRTEVTQVASKENIDAIIKLMRGVVDGSSDISTGTAYYKKGYDIIGKTGTAEIASSSGGYLTGSVNYVRSFAALFPGNDPEIVVYVAASKLNNSKKLTTAVNDLITNVGTYLNIYDKTISEDIGTYSIESYVSKNTKDVSDKLLSSNMNVVVLGSGDKIIDQYPKNNTKLSIGNKVFLLTNSNEYKMPKIDGWSRNDVTTLCNMLGLIPTFSGYGYVKEYSLAASSVVKKGDKINIVLETKYKDENETNETNTTKEKAH